MLPGARTYNHDTKTPAGHTMWSGEVTVPPALEDTARDPTKTRHLFTRFLRSCGLKHLVTTLTGKLPRASRHPGRPKHSHLTATGEDQTPARVPRRTLACPSRGSPTEKQLPRSGWTSSGLCASSWGISGPALNPALALDFEGTRTPGPKTGTHDHTPGLSSSEPQMLLCPARKEARRCFVP